MSVEQGRFILIVRFDTSHVMWIGGADGAHEFRQLEFELRTNRFRIDGRHPPRPGDHRFELGFHDVCHGPTRTTFREEAVHNRIRRRVDHIDRLLLNSVPVSVTKPLTFIHNQARVMLDRELGIYPLLTRHVKVRMLRTVIVQLTGQTLVIPLGKQAHFVHENDQSLWSSLDKIQARLIVFEVNERPVDKL
jgi:hypothetical protein